MDRDGLSLDVQGRLEGGGLCLNCRDHTKGINCNQCVDGYFRPAGKLWNETDVCKRELGDLFDLLPNLEILD